MSILHTFEALVIAHILFGAPGLLSFWVPVATRKGNRLHRLWGRAFVFMMLATGTFAIGMSSMTILYPVETHPGLIGHAQFGDPELIRAIFGWMMLYLAVLTINLAWYGRMCIVNRQAHARNRTGINLALQALLLAAASNCAIRGILIGQPMMVAISMVGFATVATNLWFMVRARPGPLEWLTEHIKALVGTGISVYTAFFAFGAVRLVPELAFAPIVWAVPLITGLALILYHQRAVTRPLRRTQPGRAR